ncbi:sugar ABC transporter substrate-binding protein [Kribbella sp. NPDC051952]|uniref:ABC transporter substrate-binding protein n=1 Tax=Kribbella sp. NPDC051952 TaxID=3154851 RepID=UPI0034240AC4
MERTLTRRGLLAGGVALSGAALLSACSSGGSAAQGGGGKLQVTVWLGAEELKATQKFFKQFETAHPNISVELINIVNGGPYGSTKLQQMIAGGAAPDVMMLNSGQFESFASRKALLPLDDLVAKDKVDLSAYWPQAITGSKFDDKLYGMPKDLSNVIVYLNTTLFAKAGVPLPPADWNWEQYRATAKELTAKLNTGSKVTKWGTILVNADWNWSPFVWTNGGEVYEGKDCKLADPKSVEALDYYFGLRTKDNAAPTPGALASFGTQNAEQAAFLGGAIGFGIFGPWLRPGLIATKGMEWAVRPVPRGPEGQEPVIPVFTDMWGISATTKRKDDAWTLVKWLSSKEGLQSWLDIYGGRSITPMKNLALGEQWLSYGGAKHRADNQAILNQMTDSNRKPAVAFANGAEAQTLWNNEFKVAVVGQETAQQAVDKVCPRLTTILGRQR